MGAPCRTTSGTTSTSRRATATRSSSRPTRSTSPARRSWPTGRSRTGSCSRDEDRAAANARLAPYIKAIEARKAATQARIDARLAGLTDDLTELRTQAEQATDAEVAVAVNTAILRQASTDVVAFIRLGRAYDELGAIDRARESFQQALAIDPKNRIADRRLNDIDRRGR